MIRLTVMILGLVLICAIVVVMYCCLIVASREDDILERMLENKRMGTMGKNITGKTENQENEKYKTKI